MSEPPIDPELRVVTSRLQRSRSSRVLLNVTSSSEKDVPPSFRVAVNEKGESRRSMSVHTSLIFLLSKDFIVSSQTPSLNSSHSCLATPFCQWTQKPLLHIMRANHSHVHRHLSFKQHSVPLWPLNAKVRLSLASISVPQEFASSLLSAAPFSIRSSTLLPARRAFPWWAAPPRPPDYVARFACGGDVAVRTLDATGEGLAPKKCLLEFVFETLRGRESAAAQCTHKEAVRRGCCGRSARAVCQRVSLVA